MSRGSTLRIFRVLNSEATKLMMNDEIYKEYIATSEQSSLISNDKIRYLQYYKIHHIEPLRSLKLWVKNTSADLTVKPSMDDLVLLTELGSTDFISTFTVLIDFFNLGRGHLNTVDSDPDIHVFTPTEVNDLHAVLSYFTSSLRTDKRVKRELEDTFLSYNSFFDAFNEAYSDIDNDDYDNPIYALRRLLLFVNYYIELINDAFLDKDTYELTYTYWY